ncbi:unnamed protein product [Rotaria socialis]|uniref:Probable pectate lyase F n=1 Tax=Rotaria socialis TaxID=392032 RepID=A0A818I4V2_9BILA|nr:unnamed protein product [Rotaria socialis]
MKMFGTCTILLLFFLIDTISTAAVTTFPRATGNVTYTNARVLAQNEIFDGAMRRFDRGRGACKQQVEGGKADAVFILENGATLKNVIIGPDQAEGVHCQGSCNIINVWWEDVCEDALTIRQISGTTRITGGGAKSAQDKVIQHNGGGTIIVTDFYVQDFGKLWRSCGNCGTQYPRHLQLNGVIAKNGKVLAGGNGNYNDTVRISNTCATNVISICDTYKGCNNGCAPAKISSGPSSVCLYRTTDIRC